jgi:hypothetical protein
VRLFFRPGPVGCPEADAAALTRLGPYAVAGAVGATLARLGNGPVRLAHAVAVLEDAPLVTAARLAGVGLEQASAFGEQLVRAGILRDVRPLEFEHGLVRDAVLRGLTAGERARLHAAARILEQVGHAGPAREQAQDRPLPSVAERRVGRRSGHGRGQWSWRRMSLGGLRRETSSPCPPRARRRIG